MARAPKRNMRHRPKNSWYRRDNPIYPVHIIREQLDGDDKAGSTLWQG